MRILAIDPSIRSTGYSILDLEIISNRAMITVKEVNRIVTKKTKEEDMDETITDIAKELLTVARGYDVDSVLLEGGYIGVNGKTALLLAGLRQSIITVFKLYDYQIDTELPSVIRSILMGQGSASKQEIAEHVQTVFINNEQVKALGEFCDRSGKKKNDDMYDSISIGLSGLIPMVPKDIVICYY